MILYEWAGCTEDNPIYQELEVSNGSRQYDFLRSLVLTSLKTDQRYLASNSIKALNYHAITCLHDHAGKYRPCQVFVGNHEPPQHYRVQSLMDGFINSVNRSWDQWDPLLLASFILWRLNFIHPFVNGNGRTARATCYFALCLKLDSWLPGKTILPELIRRERDKYVQALQHADLSLQTGTLDLKPLQSLLALLLREQVYDK